MPRDKGKKSEYNKTYQAAHKEKIAEYNKIWRIKHKEKRAKCQRNVRLKNLYGITIEDYNRLFVEQDGCCAICGRHQFEFERALAVDHDHKIGKVRGLLCHGCNMGLGAFYNDDNTRILKEAIKYVEESETRRLVYNGNK